MNRILCAMTLVIMMAAYHAANAENLWFGLRAGPSVPRLSGGNNEVSRGYSSIMAPNFGVTVEHFLTEQFSVQCEVDYSGQGGERDGLQPITIEQEGLPQMPPGQYFTATSRIKASSTTSRFRPWLNTIGGILITGAILSRAART